MRLDGTQVCPLLLYNLGVSYLDTKFQKNAVYMPLDQDKIEPLNSFLRFR